ncbi:MAG TPA: FGGY family carbohydrate kinase [Chitinophagaceae bacterium]
MALPVIVIFDVGKTNKKVLLYDEQYMLLEEESIQLAETVDEDGFPTENINELRQWIKQELSEILTRDDIYVKAINFSGYGASFAYIDKTGRTIAPLYNYLKPYPEYLKKRFYDQYGGESKIAKETASPVLGSLNSGMQLYRLKYEQPQVYQHLKYALHLPQYLSFIVSGKPATDVSSVGCHTNLWDFQKHSYHKWVYAEELYRKFAPLHHGDKITTAWIGRNRIRTGIGLHDSSAALIPYLAVFREPFILLSTGTWNISLNPFNHKELTYEELKQDCLCYLTYEGRPVKASRFFAGYEHGQHMKRLGDHFNKAKDYHESIQFNDLFFTNTGSLKERVLQTPFHEIDLNEFQTYEEAYHWMMRGIVKQQAESTDLVLRDTKVKRIFVDGGFGRNLIYMNLLAKAFPSIEVYAATIPQASALGAALAIHRSWNKNPLPSNLVELQYYTNTEMNFSI